MIKQLKKAMPRHFEIDDVGRKTYRKGTHRAISPTETLARVQSFMSEIGITRVADVTGLDRIGLPVVMVCRPNARSLAVSQGKGLTLHAAKASGVMEAIEAFHAEYLTLPLKFGSMNDLAQSHSMIAVDDLPRIKGSYYRDSLPMLWIESLELISGSPRWLPFEIVHSNFTLPPPPGSGCFVCSTNGLASGNHLLEAICHGVCEIIERDATAIWHRLQNDRQVATRVKPDSVYDKMCAATISRIRSAELELGVWETTTDIGVPSYCCMIVDRTEQSPHIGFGAGCHPAREVAMLRALTEAVQVRMTYITGARDDLTNAEFTKKVLTERQGGVRWMIDRAPPRRDFRAAPSFNGETFSEDLEWIVDRLRTVGVLEVLVVDLTSPKMNIPVVRVVVPGLEAPDDDDEYIPGPRALAANIHVP